MYKITNPIYFVKLTISTKYDFIFVEFLQELRTHIYLSQLLPS